MPLIVKNAFLICVAVVLAQALLYAANYPRESCHKPKDDFLNGWYQECINGECFDYPCDYEALHYWKQETTKTGVPKLWGTAIDNSECRVGVKPNGEFWAKHCMIDDTVYGYISIPPASNSQLP